MPFTSYALKPASLKRFRPSTKSECLFLCACKNNYCILNVPLYQEALLSEVLHTVCVIMSLLIGSLVDRPFECLSFHYAEEPNKTDEAPLMTSICEMFSIGTSCYSTPPWSPFISGIPSTITITLELAITRHYHYECWLVHLQYELRATGSWFD